MDRYHMDEQEATDILESMIGVDRSFRLMRIWQETSNPTSLYPLSPSEKAKKRVDWFRRKAKDNGYPEKAISHYIHNIQGL